MGIRHHAAVGVICAALALAGCAASKAGSPGVGAQGVSPGASTPAVPTPAGRVAGAPDSPAGLPSELIDTHDLTVVPLTVTIDSASGREGVDVSPEDVAKALVARRTSVTTSRPSPADFSTAYGRLLDQ